MHKADEIDTVSLTGGGGGEGGTLQGRTLQTLTSAFSDDRSDTR